MDKGRIRFILCAWGKRLIDLFDLSICISYFYRKVTNTLSRQLKLSSLSSSRRNTDGLFHLRKSLPQVFLNFNVQDSFGFRVHNTLGYFSWFHAPNMFIRMNFIFLNPYHKCLIPQFVFEGTPRNIQQLFNFRCYCYSSVSSINSPTRHNIQAQYLLQFYILKLTLLYHTYSEIYVGLSSVLSLWHIYGILMAYFTTAIIEVLNAFNNFTTYHYI